MAKSATDLMQEIIFSAVLDSIGALKRASKGLPNLLLRDINAVHANTTFADLPKELQTAITASVRTAFTRLLREGYSVSIGQGSPLRNPSSKQEATGQVSRKSKPSAKRNGSHARRPSPNGGQPSRKPRRS